MYTTLDGIRILVTGAASGIGAASVHVLTEAGARVAATFHNTAPTPDAAPISGSTAPHWLHCDVTDQESVDAAFTEATETLGGLDVLVHAAGRWAGHVPGQITVDDLQTMLDINFVSTVLTNQAAFTAMSAGGGGRIINFGSSEGVSGSTISAPYAAAKAAVHSWTRSAARAWAPRNITVNTVAPAVATPGADRRWEFVGPQAAEQFRKQLQSAIPLGGHLGDPQDDLGPVLVFLAGAGARFITGQFLAVNGGLLMVGG
ncbi:MAG: SDR family oxidoreductase [Gordonia sp. (in: high G+C Gram-positive bacteria)]